MKKSELKEMIKDCVKEVLFEEGTLSTIIAEVAYGLTSARSLVEKQNTVEVVQPAADNSLNLSQQAQRKKLEETKKKMLDAIGNSSMKGIFEGTEPLRSGGAPNSETSPSSPLSHIAPGDAGVDISGILNIAGSSWERLKK